MVVEELRKRTECTKAGLLVGARPSSKHAGMKTSSHMRRDTLQKTHPERLHSLSNTNERLH